MLREARCTRFHCALASSGSLDDLLNPRLIVCVHGNSKSYILAQSAGCLTPALKDGRSPAFSKSSCLMYCIKLADFHCPAFKISASVKPLKRISWHVHSFVQKCINKLSYLPLRGHVGSRVCRNCQDPAHTKHARLGEVSLVLSLGLCGAMAARHLRIQQRTCPIVCALGTSQESHCSSKRA